MKYTNDCHLLVSIVKQHLVKCDSKVKNRTSKKRKEVSIIHLQFNILSNEASTTNNVNGPLNPLRFPRVLLPQSKRVTRRPRKYYKRLLFPDGVSENRRSGREHRPKKFVCRIPICTTQTGINYLSSPRRQAAGHGGRRRITGLFCRRRHRRGVERNCRVIAPA